MTTMLIDIETLPEDATVGMDLQRPPGFVMPPYEAVQRSVPRNYKDPAKILVWQQAEFQRQAEEGLKWAGDKHAEAESNYRQRSLSPMTARIACIGYALDHNPAQVIRCDDNERDGLETLMGVIKSRRPSVVIAHNGHGFDYDFLWKRLMKHGHSDAMWFYQEKPWEKKLQDTYLKWSKANRRGGNMDDICKFFGWEREDNPIRGGEVLDAYIDGRMSDVVAHCRGDIEDLRKLALKLEMM